MNSNEVLQKRIQAFLPNNAIADVSQQESQTLARANDRKIMISLMDNNKVYRISFTCSEIDLGLTDVQWERYYIQPNLQRLADQVRSV